MDVPLAGLSLSFNGIFDASLNEAGDELLCGAMFGTLDLRNGFISIGEGCDRWSDD